MPLEIPELLMGVFGALLFVAVNSLGRRARGLASQPSKVASTDPSEAANDAGDASLKDAAKQVPCKPPAPAPAAASGGGKERKQEAAEKAHAAAVAAARLLQATGWQAEEASEPSRAAVGAQVVSTDPSSTPEWRRRGPNPEPALPARHQPALVAQTPSRQPSIVPVVPPVLRGEGLEAQLQELLALISPTEEDHLAVARIAAAAEAALRATLSGVAVTGYAFGNLRRRTAYGVAVPVVDLVVAMSSQVLERAFLRSAGDALGTSAEDHDAGAEAKTEKWALRVCTDALVSSGWKFRRSAFRFEKPKVTLMAPAPLLGGGGDHVAMDLSINSSRPEQEMALLMEARHLEPRSEELMLVVQRWARDRGIAQATKGHLSPYAWNVLVAFYLQVGLEHPALPVLHTSARSVALVPATCGKGGAATAHGPAAATAAKAAKKSNANGTSVCAGGQAATDEAKSKLTAAQLLEGFMCFYATSFDWQGELVSLRRGRRLPAEIFAPTRFDCLVGPNIEDPFDASANLGAPVTSQGFARVQEEVQRAHKLLNSGASLTDLLQPWHPDEAEERSSSRAGTPDAPSGSGGLGEQPKQQASSALPAKLSSPPLSLTSLPSRRLGRQDSQL